MEFHPNDWLGRWQNFESYITSTDPYLKLAWQEAEAAAAARITGEHPVLLLDDVLSELDPRRQEFVLNRIRGGQVFITCCEDDQLPQLLGGRIFHVRNGSIQA